MIKDRAERRARAARDTRRYRVNYGVAAPYEVNQEFNERDLKDRLENGTKAHPYDVD